MSAGGSAATEEDSKPEPAFSGFGRLSLVVLTLGVVGGVLLCVTEVTTVVSIRAGGTVQASQSGQDQHGLALLLLGVAALPLSWLATSGRARGGAVLAALSGLAVIGLVALLLWALGDLPDTGETGSFGVGSTPATAGPGVGFYLELAGALCLLASALVGLVGFTKPRTSSASRSG